MSFDWVLFYSISSLNYTEINEIFLTGENKNSCTVHIFRYDAKVFAISAD
jgi:hypothetical protein